MYNKPANVSMRKIYDDMCIKMSYNFIYAYCVQQMSALGFFYFKCERMWICHVKGNVKDMSSKTYTTISF